jgi:hypothetical protein
MVCEQDWLRPLQVRVPRQVLIAGVAGELQERLCSVSTRSATTDSSSLRVEAQTR